LFFLLQWLKRLGTVIFINEIELMGRSNETFSKKEKEKKKIAKRKEKLAKKEARKENATSGSLDDMIAYVDENGVITDTPPDPTKKKKVIKASSIEIGVPKREDIEIDPVHQGIVAFFNDEKGYGFIKDLESQDSYFVHINNTKEPISEGNKVSFELESGPKGPVAVKVSIVKNEPKPAPKPAPKAESTETESTTDEADAKAEAGEEEEEE
jgi:cold shock CspA family protein